VEGVQPATGASSSVEGAVTYSSVKLQHTEGRERGGRNGTDVASARAEMRALREALRSQQGLLRQH
jgi:hypothetical protein